MTPRRFPFGHTPAPGGDPVAQRTRTLPQRTAPLDDFVPPERVLPFDVPARPALPSLSDAPAPPPPPAPAPAPARSRRALWIAIAIALLALDAAAIWLAVASPWRP